MHKLLILLALVLFGCNHPFDCIDEMNAGGMYLCFENKHNITAEMIEETVEITQKEAQVHYPQVTDLRDQLEAHGTTTFFIKDSIVKDCYSPHADMHNVSFCKTEAAGVNFKGNWMAIEHSSCFALVTLSHELLHSVEHFYLGGPMGDHETSHMFYTNLETEEEKEATIEAKAKVHLWDKCWHHLHTGEWLP